MSYSNTILNKFPIKDQEDLMHRIHDVVHIGVSNCSLSIMLDNYGEKYNLKEVLNSRLKNEKYSENLEYPISKVLYQDRTYVMSPSDDDFYKKKLDILKMLVSYGADISKVNGPYSYYTKIDLDEMKARNLINDEIINFLKLS
jgi:hypothetical protein